LNHEVYQALMENLGDIPKRLTFPIWHMFMHFHMSMQPPLIVGSVTTAALHPTECYCAALH
jgi:hypothetical protein